MEKAFQTWYFPTESVWIAPGSPQCPCGCSSHSLLGAIASKSICNIYNLCSRIKQILISEPMPYVCRVLYMCCPHCSGYRPSEFTLCSWHLPTSTLGYHLACGTYIPPRMQCANANADLCPQCFPFLIHIHSVNIYWASTLYQPPDKAEKRRDKSPCLRVADTTPPTPTFHPTLWLFALGFLIDTSSLNWGRWWG